MAEESDLEKTEPASSRRLEQAREEGQVPRSREIGAFLVLMVGAIAFSSVGPWMMQRTTAIVRRGLMLDASELSDPQFLMRRVTDRLDSRATTRAARITTSPRSLPLGLRFRHGLRIRSTYSWLYQ